MTTLATPQLAKFNLGHFLAKHTTLMFALFFAMVLMMPELSFAQAVSSDITAACTTTKGFMTTIVNILEVVSVAVVTIAIIFAGYQIAFAHKRVTDVAPILIGAFLIGAAGQIAAMMINNSVGCK